MADNSILTPGYQTPVQLASTPTQDKTYLDKDNYLSEFSTEGEKAVVRENLNVPSKDTVYDKSEVNTQIALKIQTALQEYLNMEDPHGILPVVRELIEGMVKTDGSTPFVAPQLGVDPLADNHLTTKKFVTRLLKEHTNAEDPHGILPEVEDLLQSYVKATEVYHKTQLYTQNDVDKLLSKYVKLDGTTPLTKALIGADPSIDSHLATKRYVDKTLYNHLVDIDPHGFLTILNNRLASYIKKKDVYDKTQTYSRTLVDSMITVAVAQQVELAIADYIDSINDKFEEIRKAHYVKQDGSIPFRSTQKGVDAVEDQDLVTLHQVKEAVEEASTTLSELINSKECVWITSGPVESTVGHVDDNTPVPATMTLQEVCDAIFYGKGICLEVPEFVIITEKCPVTMCIHGSTGLIEYAELYQNGSLIGTYERDAFENGCVTVESLPLLEDAEFTFRVIYTNGSVHEETKTVKCYLPVFVGALPKWQFGNVITMDMLIQLCREDENNRFLNYGKDLSTFTFKYNFKDPQLRHPFVVLPADYNDLESMVTKSQSFGIDAFDVIDMIPLTVPGVPNDIIFKVYIYKQALSSLNQEVTFNFES